MASVHVHQRSWWIILLTLLLLASGGHRGTSNKGGSRNRELWYRETALYNEIAMWPTISKCFWRCSPPDSSDISSLIGIWNHVSCVNWSHKVEKESNTLHDPHPGKIWNSNVCSNIRNLFIFTYLQMFILYIFCIYTSLQISIRTLCILFSSN